jgi:hypothetical protein
MNRQLSSANNLGLATGGVGTGITLSLTLSLLIRAGKIREYQKYRHTFPLGAATARSANNNNIQSQNYHRHFSSLFNYILE